MERVTAGVGEEGDCRRIGWMWFNRLNRGWDGWKKWPIEIARMTGGGVDWTGLNERMELGCCGRKCKATKS